MLTVTDSTTSVVDKVKVVASGVFIDQSANGLLQIFDPPAGPAAIANSTAQLLAQSMAAFGAGGGAGETVTGHAANSDAARESLALNSLHHHG